MRFLNGMLAAAATLGILATGMGTVNFTVRTFAARRVAAKGDDLTAEALLLMF